MSTQIFKSKISNDVFFSFLESICFKSDKYYTINFIAFKKGLYNEKIQEFIKMCIPYYHNSKQKYVEKPLTYKSFATILRQICNFNSILYTTKILYCKSEYEIVYYIYF